MAILRPTNTPYSQKTYLTLKYIGIISIKIQLNNKNIIRLK